MMLPVPRLIARSALLVLAAGAPLAAQGPLTARTSIAQSKTAPIVVVVLDDTKLISAGRSRLAATGFDAVHRQLLTDGVQVGAITSGPGGLLLDATDDAAVLVSISASVRKGAYNFGAAADEAKAAVALDATIAHILRRVTRVTDGPKVLVVIGRSAVASPERQAGLAASRTTAAGARAQIVWLDLESNGCDRAPARDAQLLTDADHCAALDDAASIDRTLVEARRFIAP